MRFESRLFSESQFVYLPVQQSIRTYVLSFWWQSIFNCRQICIGWSPWYYTCFFQVRWQVLRKQRGKTEWAIVLKRSGWRCIPPQDIAQCKTFVCMTYSPNTCSRFLGNLVQFWDGVSAQFASENIYSHFVDILSSSLHLPTGSQGKGRVQQNFDFTKVGTSQPQWFPGFANAQTLSLTL